MDFQLSEEQEFFRATVADTVDRLIMPKVQEIDETDEFPWELWKEFTGLGYLGLRYPESVGGMDADPVTAMLFYEEIARGSAGFSQSATMNMLMGTYFLFRFGSRRHQGALLPARHPRREDRHHLLHRGPVGLGHRRDPHPGREGRRRLGAERHQELDHERPHLRLRHRARHAPIRRRAPRRSTSSWSRRARQGFSPGQVLHKMGCRGTVTGELVFEDVFVPDENLLGEEAEPRGDVPERDPERGALHDGRLCHRHRPHRRARRLGVRPEAPGLRPGRSATTNSSARSSPASRWNWRPRA